MSEQKTGGNAAAVSVVIPLKDEGGSLKELYRQLTLELEKLGRPFEILFVNDGSGDDSGAVLSGIQSQDPRVKVLEFTRNFGKAAALSAGLEAASGEYIITIDADLQDDPKELGRFIERLDQGLDFVSGWKVRRQDPLGKRFLSRIFNFTVRAITGVRLHDFNCGYKAMKREAVSGLSLYGELHRYLAVMVAYRGFKVGELEVVHHPRRFGRSKYGLSRIPRGFFDLLTILFISQYAYRPLHLFGGFGSVLGLLGFAGLCYLTALWFLGHRPIGTRPLFLGSVMLLLLGFQLLSLGLVGELLLKLNIRQDKPYIIKRRLP